MTLQELIAERELVVERLIDAPIQLVWKACTDAKHIVHWWGPEGWTCDTAEIDISEGGVWRFTMNGPDGLAFKNRLRFKTIRPYDLIAFVHDDDGVGKIAAFDSTFTLSEQGEKTLVTIRNVFKSAEIKQAMEKFGAVEGGQSTLGCLEEYVARHFKPEALA